MTLARRSLLPLFLPTLATALALSLAVPAAAEAAAGRPTLLAPPPTSMASMGDSITRGFNACGFFVDCPSRSFSTGTTGR